MSILLIPLRALLTLLVGRLKTSEGFLFFFPCSISVYSKNLHQVYGFESPEKLLAKAGVGGGGVEGVEVEGAILSL